MYKVLVGAISPEGEHLLTSYLEKFMPDTQVEPLKPAGIKGRMKNHATKNDVLLVILDTVLWDNCVGVVDAVLALPKVHKYESDEGLREFLVSKFGPLDDIEGTGTIPPDMLMGQEAEDEEDEFIPKQADFSKESSTGETVPPDKLGETGGAGPAIVDDELPVTEESEDIAETDAPSEVVEKLNGQVRDLQSKLAGKEALIRSLTLQLNDKTKSDQDDISAMIGRIRELESELAAKEAQLSNTDNDNYVNLGKVARAEQVLGEFDDLRQQVKTLTSEKASAEQERDRLSGELKSLSEEVGGLREQVSHIPELNKSLAEKTKRVGALELEIAEKSKSIEELESQVETNSGVAGELQQLKAELEVLQHQIDEDKDKLKRLDDAEDELTAKQLTIDNLRVDIKALNDTISSQSNDIAKLNGELQGKGVDLEEARRELEEVRQDLKDKTEELAEAVKARDEALAKVNESADYSETLVQSTQSLSQRITDLTGELTDKTTQLEAVMGQLREAEDSVTSLSTQLENVRNDLSAKSDECAGLEQKLEEVEGQLSEAQTQLEELKSNSSASMTEIQGKLDAKDTEITGLRDEIVTKDGTITKLTGDISSLHEQLAAKTTEITQIRGQLDEVRKQLLDAQSAGDDANIQADTQRKALESVLAEKKELEDKLVAAESKRLELEGDIRSLEADLSQERQFRSSVDDSNIELTAQNEKLTNTIKQLEDSLIKAQADDAMTARLESELLEERRRSSRLQAEVDVLKKTSGADKSSELRVELVRVKNELASLQESTVAVSEVERVRSDLAEARDRIAQLELDLVEKDHQMAESSSNIFSQLRNIAIPKGAYDLRLPEVTGLSPDKFICVASGSEESTASVYQSLRSACNATQKRVVFVDLVTDSSIDKEFGIKKIVSPIDWLTGVAPFRNFLADTRYGHVKVLSTALAYINDLFLLTVDWQRCLMELEGFSANTVVLYVGCLNNLATKVLFDMFSRAMKSYVIVKATPVNLRTTILNLTGFKELSQNVSVECVNFSDTSSAAMYKRLVAKYRAHIVRETDVLQL